MTKINILSAVERKKFDSPPKLSAEARTLHFSLPEIAEEFANKIKAPANKVRFVLQFGYFKANAKFYRAEQLREKDIEYVSKILGIYNNDIVTLPYSERTHRFYHKIILQTLNWQPFGKSQQDKIISLIQRLAQQQSSPKIIFSSVINFCWQHKIEVPSYNILATLITDSYNYYEEVITKAIRSKLTTHQRNKLNLLIHNDNNKPLSKAPITLLKQVNQSLLPSAIKDNVEALIIFKEYFNEFKETIEELQLSNQATEYFSTWVQKSTAFQLLRFANKDKLYMHLLCYIKYQYYYRQDALVDIFLKSIKSVVNNAINKMNLIDKATRVEKNKTIKSIITSHKNHRNLVDEITLILQEHHTAKDCKLNRIEELINNFHKHATTESKEQILAVEDTLDKIAKDNAYFDLLESLSNKLLRRVSSIVKVLEFNVCASQPNLIKAIKVFKAKDGELNNNSPTDFLNHEEKKAVFRVGKLRISLYKALLSIYIAEAIKSGVVNLSYSFRYKSIDDYLIDEKTWE